jgi:predicted nucleic acid-binding protein
MVVMKELDVKDIITGDEHFEYVGMGFQRKP